LHGLGHVFGRDLRRHVQVGDGAGYFQYPVIGPGGEAEMFDAPMQDFGGPVIQPAVLFQQARSHLAVAVYPLQPVKTLLLNGPGPSDPFPYRRRRTPLLHGEFCQIRKLFSGKQDLGTLRIFAGGKRIEGIKRGAIV